ncbi:MAG: ROK family protein [Propionibacteriaceae bacterium]|nr:ROK family protein [Propionibacteriaceae bacterium]
MRHNQHGRADHTARVFTTLAQAQRATLTELTGETELSRPTVTSIITELESAGLVASPGSDGGQGRRPAAVWAVADTAGIVIGADLLPSSMLLSVATLSGKVLSARVHTVPESGRDRRLAEVATFLKDAAEEFVAHGPLRAVGLSTTGIIDGEGTVVRSDLVPQWAGLPLAAELRERLGVPVRVENDINASGFGEFALRRDEGEVEHNADVLFIQLIRGLHTGLVLSGDLHRGRSWNAGEITDVLGIHLLGDGEGSDAAWLDRAALTLGAVSAVVDPSVIVVAAPNQISHQNIAAISARLVDTRPSTAPSMRMEPARLGWAAAGFGALSLALRDALAHLLGAPAGPVQLRGHELLTHQLSEGRHTTMPLDTTAASAEPTSRLRIGVIGVGARSKLALHAEQEGLDAAITAVADPHPKVRERVATRLERDPDSVTITSSVTDLIRAGVDAAFVTSPDDTHAEVTCELLEAGIPVYLEKPLAITLDDATRILETAHATGTRLYVGHNMRHMNVVRSMRDIIRTGRIGEVKAIWCRHFVGSGGDFYFKDWHATREHGTGLLLQKAAHDIDVMHWLAESHTTRVVGMGGLTVYGDITDRKDRSDELMSDWYSLDNWPPLTQTGLNPVVDVEDISMMLMEMESGVFASYQQCHYTPDYWRNYTVIGTEGRIENFGDGEGGHIKLWNRRTTYSPDGDEQFPILGDAQGHHDADALTVAEFLRFVRHGSATDTSPLGAWYSVAAGIQATESIRDNSSLREVPALPDSLVNYFNHNQVK